MAAYQKAGVWAFLSLLYLHYSFASVLPVPLVLWSTGNNIKDVPTITYGKTNELSALYKKYIEPRMGSKSLVLLFLQDELSKDDLTKYSSSFTHLQKVMETEKFLFFPSVSEDKGITQLMSESTKDVEYVDSGSLNDWNYRPAVDRNATKIVVFYLEPVTGSHSNGRGEILERNDLIMHKIIKTSKEKVQDFDVVYTAEDPSEMVTNFILNEKIADVGFGSRHLLAENEQNDTERFFNNSCVLMYATSITYRNREVNITEFIKPGAGTWKTGGCGSHNLGCSMSIEKVGQFGGFLNATLLMEFKNDSQQWFCEMLHFSGYYAGKPFKTTFNCGNESTGFQSPVYDTIMAPIGMSFACQEMKFSFNNTDHLTLGGFQVETFCDGKGITKGWQFSSAYNCVGFFTIEILTGIFVTIVLMMGLYIGVMMMMAIQVQDRFDDPKGKTISTVTTNE